MDTIIRYLRLQKGLGLRELAKICGITPTTLSSIETGKNKRPTYRTLNKIAEGLGVSVRDLLGRAEIVIHYD